MQLRLYDDGGRRTKVQNILGQATTFAYDNMRRLLSKTPDASLNQPTISFTYNEEGKNKERKIDGKKFEPLRHNLKLHSN
jgi:YD repeat-containing protein